MTSSAMDEASTEQTELMCCLGSLLVHTMAGPTAVSSPVPEAPAVVAEALLVPSAMTAARVVAVGAERDRSWLPPIGLVMDKEFRMRSSVLRFSGLRTGDGRPTPPAALTPTPLDSPLRCISNRCNEEFRMGPGALLLAPPGGEAPAAAAAPFGLGEPEATDDDEGRSERMSDKGDMLLNKVEGTDEDKIWDPAAPPPSSTSNPAAGDGEDTCWPLAANRNKVRACF